MSKNFQKNYLSALIFSFVIIVSVSSAVISSQDGEIEFLDSHDQVIKLYNVDKDLLDTSLESSNPKNPIKCLTSILNIGSDQVSEQGIAIKTYAAYITNKSFYIVYDTSNSPSHISSLRVKWICFKSDDVYLFDFQYDADQQQGFRYKALEYQASNGTTLSISSLGPLSDLQTSFLITGFSVVSTSNIKLNVKIAQNSNNIEALLVEDNLQSINKVYGKIIASSKDICSSVNITQPKTQETVSKLKGNFESFKEKHYVSFFGIEGFTLNQLQNLSQFNFDLNEFSVNYQKENISGTLSQQNGQAYVSSIICKIDDKNISDSGIDVLVGSLTVIFGLILYLLSTLIYTKKKKQHVILDDYNQNQQVYTDNDQSHATNRIAQKL